jgi:cell division protein FtsB
MIPTINKSKVANFILCGVCVLLLCLLFNKCENENLQLANVDALNSQLTTYKLKNGQLVTSAQTLSYTNAQLKNSLLGKDKTLKQVMAKFAKVQSVTKYVTTTKIDTIAITYKDSIPCVFEINDAIFHQWYSLGYNSNQKGITITELSIPDSVAIVTGTKRKWFLGKQTQTIDITHANPFVETETVQHIEVVAKPKWYETTLFKILLGATGGYLLAK